MARFHYTILSRAVPGREEEFIAWYRDRHLADVCRMPGIVGGKLFRMDFQRVYELDEAPQWTLMTIYELEGDAPEPIIDSIRVGLGRDARQRCADQGRDDPGRRSSDRFSRRLLLRRAAIPRRAPPAIAGALVSQ